MANSGNDNAGAHSQQHVRQHVLPVFGGAVWVDAGRMDKHLRRRESNRDRTNEQWGTRANRDLVIKGREQPRFSE